jgi:hypothetical protein
MQTVAGLGQLLKPRFMELGYVGKVLVHYLHSTSPAWNGTVGEPNQDPRSTDTVLMQHTAFFYLSNYRRLRCGKFSGIRSQFGPGYEVEVYTLYFEPHPAIKRSWETCYLSREQILNFKRTHFLRCFATGMILQY